MAEGGQGWAGVAEGGQGWTGVDRGGLRVKGIF